MANNNLVIENAQLAFKNFSGKGDNFNTEGNRNFCILLDDDIAKALEKDKLNKHGDTWNIKHLKPRDPEDKEQAYINVKVKFDNRPPKIVLMSSNGKSILNEESVNSLDWAEIDTVDCIITPYAWEMNGRHGITAYLKSMYVKIVEDELEKKYLDTPHSAESCIGGCGGCDTCDGTCHES